MNEVYTPTMNEWQDFLTGAGVRIEDGLVQPFSSVRQEAEAVGEETTLTPLTHVGVIRVGGEDAADFLQNQLTNDLREVTLERSQLTAWCSPKGRVLACFRLFRTEEYHYLLLPKAILPATLERLKKYVLISRVTLEDASEECALLGVAGAGAEKLLREAGHDSPPGVNEVVRGEGHTLLGIPGPQPRFIAVGDGAQIIPLWSSLKGRATPVGTSAWRLLDIRAGLPDIHPETVEAFVPQMINLDLLGGISFDKGCYPGQEVVARLRYLGKLKRRMYRARIECAASPQPGEPLRLAGEGRDTGKIVEAQPAAPDGYELLAVVEIASVENGETIALEKEPQSVLQFLELPYSLE